MNFERHKKVTLYMKKIEEHLSKKDISQARHFLAKAKDILDNDFNSQLKSGVSAYFGPVPENFWELSKENWTGQVGQGK